MIPLFDLHCDTLSELYNNSADFKNNNLHISKNKVKAFSPYIQVFAIWSASSLSNEEAYLNFSKVYSYANIQNIYFVKDYSKLRQNSNILAVEDARLLNGDIQRLDKLYALGVRILTLCWKDFSIIGGAWNTEKGLTSFGFEVINRCFKLGVIPDISHASIKSSEQAIEIAFCYNKPLIASHSNSYSICPHKRNLTDDLFLKVLKTNGLVGISLASEHISVNSPTIKNILNHIYHFLSLGGENSICLGCDFDGVSSLPCEISSISDLNKLFFAVEKAFGYDFALKLFFENAFRFFSNI